MNTERILLLLVVGFTAIAHIQAACNPQDCTSPSASGGTDCWAGSKHEGCTCSSGKAATTGAKVTYKGTDYFGYQCCDSEASAQAANYTWIGSDKCGAYSPAASIQVLSLGMLGFIALVSMLL